MLSPGSTRHSRAGPARMLGHGIVHGDDQPGHDRDSDLHLRRAAEEPDCDADRKRGQRHQQPGGYLLPGHVRRRFQPGNCRDAYRDAGLRRDVCGLVRPFPARSRSPARARSRTTTPPQERERNVHGPPPSCLKRAWRCRSPARVSGAVSSSPAGIACPGTCAARLHPGDRGHADPRGRGRRDVRGLVGRRLLGHRRLQRLDECRSGGHGDVHRGVAKALMHARAPGSEGDRSRQTHQEASVGGHAEGRRALRPVGSRKADGHDHRGPEARQAQTFAINAIKANVKAGKTETLTVKLPKSRRSRRLRREPTKRSPSRFPPRTRTAPGRPPPGSEQLRPANGLSHQGAG